MPTTRRVFLTICGTGAATALAGCTDIRNSTRDLVAAHEPIDASLSSKRVIGVRNDHGYELFNALPFADEDLPLEENDAPAVFPQRIEPETYPGLTDEAHIAPMVPDEIVVYPAYEDTVDGRSEYSVPEPPLTVETVLSDRLRASFDRFIFEGEVTIAERDDADGVNEGTRTHYLLSRTAFDTLRIGDLFRFRPAYGDPGRVSTVLERWTAY